MSDMLETILNNTQDEIVLLDKEFKITYLNSIAKQSIIFELHEGELFLDHFHPPILPFIKTAHQKGHEIILEECKLQDQTYLIKIVPLLDNTIIYLQAISQYTSINKKLQDLLDALKQSENNFKTLFDKAPEGIILYDKENDRILSINEKLFDMMHISSISITNGISLEKMNQQYHDQIKQMIFKIITEYQEKGTIQFYESIRFGQTEIDLEILIAKLPFKDQSVFRISFIDRTEENKNKQRISYLQEQMTIHAKMEAIGKLSGAIAHNFKNIVTGIIGYADLIAMVTLDEEVLTYVKFIKDSAFEMSKISNHLSAMSKNRENNPRFEDINTIISSFYDIFKVSVGSKIELILDLCDQSPNVLIDQFHFKEAMLNLLMNAKDAIPGNGKVIIRTEIITTEKMKTMIAITKGDEKQRYIAIYVEDDGQGIPETIQSNIFEPFFSSKLSTGIGLSTVYNFITQSKGYINFNSVENIGTTFNLFLPEALSD
ncbi:MAG: PAS domain-containing protein [Candidatus Heimdallarchaeota archaeon]|nr:PAS domain-containing protein [Candidatus Heimdallarchaeota archaeon]